MDMQLPRHEVYRKLIHLSSIAYPLLYLLLNDKDKMLAIVGGVFVLVLVGEAVRRYNQTINKLLSFTLRDREINRLSGAVYFMLGSFLTIALFPQAIAVLALSVLVISDTCASIIGQLYGRRKLFKQKSWVGSLAFFMSSALICFASTFYFDWPLVPLLLASFAVSFFEAISDIVKIDDNILVPLGFATVAYALQGFVL